MSLATVTEYTCDLCGALGRGTDLPKDAPKDELSIGLPSGWASISVQMPRYAPKRALHLDTGHACHRCIDRFWARRGPDLGPKLADGIVP